MKTSSSAVKVITVSVFTALIVSFVCYRAGAFDRPTSISAGNFYSSNNSMAVDTPVVPHDSILLDEKTIEIMSSSKSMQMPRVYKQDTLKKTPADTTKKKPLQKKTTMSSSKSGIIFEHEPAEDTVKPKK